MYDRSKFTTIVVTKQGHKMLNDLKRKLKFESVYAMLEEICLAIDKSHYTRLDLECLITYGKIPEIFSNEGMSEKEFFRKVGIRPDMKKTSEIPDVEKIGNLSKDLLKDKKEEEKKPE